MSVAELLRARHVGVRDLKDRLSAHLRTGKPIVATDRGTPTHILIPYRDVIELVEMLEEAADPALVAQVREGRASHARGAGVPVGRAWKRLGLTGVRSPRT